MASSGPERSLSGISLPQWMKSKISDRYDLEQSAFSPPTDDDGFFLYRYPKAKSVEPEPTIVKASKYSPLVQVVPDSQIKESYTQHTVQCKQFLPQAKTLREVGTSRVIDPPAGMVKSVGTDDGFKGEGAACGYSIVAVAQQMLSEKGDKLPCPKSERIRRNSKSLPVSPQSSPKLLKKNPYFTNILFGSVEGHQSLVGDSAKSSMEDVSSATVMSLGKMGRAFSDSDTPAPTPLITKAFRAKPTELREMNFWSPTSM